MLRRRGLLKLVTALVALAVIEFATPAAHAAGGAQVGAQQATAFIEETGRTLAGIVNGPGSEADRKAQLSAVVNRVVDVDGIARFCLGRFWRNATPEQQREYIDLFRRTLSNNIAGHLGEYRGVAMTVGHASPRENAQSVSSMITRPGQAPANVAWLVGNVGSDLKIIDVVAEGTSLRLTQRNDYASFLAQNGNKVQALLDAMRRQSGDSG